MGGEAIMRTIYLAGGCFWGVEAYMKKIGGVIDTEVGYAGGDHPEPTYREVCTGMTGHAETVMVEYDEEKVDLVRVLKHFFAIIDPTSINKQGNDVGTQYRTGIYYVHEDDLKTISEFIDGARPKYKKPIAVEVGKLSSFYPAEEYHQDYLDKNPHGYCHIDLNGFREM
jgi:methionine-S-sulfoxide reductase